MKRIFWGISCTIMLLASCSGEEEASQTITAPVVDSLAIIRAGMTPGKTVYAVPAPDEMFSFLKESKPAARHDINLHDPEKYTIYPDLKSKALNFGIYTTDLLYTSTYDMTSEVMKYFVVVRKLGDEIGVSSALNDNAMERLEASIGDPDSMVAVASELYFNAYETLEMNDRGQVLALMITGGWLESLYLVTQTSPDYEAGSDLFQRIADQKLALQNVTDYLSRYEDDSGVDEVLEQLEYLQEHFNTFREVETGATTMNNDNGKGVVGGGIRIEMNQEEYRELVSRVREVRDRFTGVNS